MQTETAARPVVRTVFHLDLSDAFPGQDYWLKAVGRRHALAPHTAATLAAARAAWPALRAVPEGRLTHYTREPVAMPMDRAVRVHVKHTLRGLAWARAETGVGHAAIHVPPAAPLPAAVPGGAQHVQYVDYVSTAKTLVFHHPDLICVDPAASATIHGYMNDDALIGSMFEVLGGQMRDMGPPTETSGWARLEPFTPPANSDTRFDGTTTYYTSTPTPEIQLAAGGVTTAMMKATKNDASLQGKKWTAQTGLSVLPAGAGAPAPSPRAGAGGDDWTPALQNTDEVHGLTAAVTVLDASKTQLRLTLTNTYIRYLGAYIRFYDAAGKAMSVPDWAPDGDQDLIATLMDIQYDDLRYIGHIGPQNNLMAIPIPPAGSLTVGITFPPGAVSATVYGAGLGTGPDTWPKAPLVGGLLTGLLNLGVPAFMLAAGTAAQAYGPAYTIVDTLLKQSPFIAGVLIPTVQLFTTFGSDGEMKMNWGAFTSLFRALFNKAATQLLLWVESQITAEEIADEVPFAGWLMVAVNISLGVAQLAETIVEVATSPWTIENGISLAITTAVAVAPDPRHGVFPQPPSGEAASLTVKMIYQDQARPAVIATQELPAKVSGSTLAASFPGNTLGGQVKFEADYRIGDWLAAKATTGWMSNDVATVAQVDLTLVEYPVPLTARSVYRHSALLTWQEGAFAWQPTPVAPTATIAATDTSPRGNAISVWAGLALSQRAGMLGPAWKAAGTGLVSCVSGTGGQLFAMQTVAIPGAPAIAGQFPVCGLDGQTLLAFDPYPPRFKMADGRWVLDPVTHRPVPDPSEAALGDYYLDPRKAANPTEQDGGYHLRLVTPDGRTPFDMGAGQPSYSRFPHQPDSIALHPGGRVAAVSRAHRRLMIGRLAGAGGVADADMPLARVYAGEALQAQRHGLVFHPVAVACSYDGTIYVLEDTKAGGGGDGPVVIARLQAFDLRGRPVCRFLDADGRPSPFLVLSTTGENTYLDLAVVGDQRMTYFYVLSFGGDGTAPADYAMAIYQYGTAPPATNPLVTTGGVAAARLAVDMWHTAYALNWDMTTDGKGNHAGPPGGATGPSGRTVPSVSEWLPPAPQGGIA